MKVSGKCKPAFYAVVLILLFVSLGRGQETSGNFTGTVRDESGAVMVGVTVTVRNTGTGLERSSVTGDSGNYRIPALPAGTYDLKAAMQGFGTTSVPNVGIAVDQTRGVDLIMKVATAAEALTVVDRVPLVESESVQLGEVIDNKKVLELPLICRNFDLVATLAPCIASFVGGGGQQGGEGGTSGFSANGMRSSSNNFLVDGIDNNNSFAGSVSQLPSVDSIQEFKVQTSTFAAEYGRNSGSVVNLITRSGSNVFHGSLFEFLRNNVLDARNFFDAPSLPQPPLRLNQYGGTLGGPIDKDQTFFFGNYEGSRQRAGITRITNVPSLNQRLGMFTNNAGQPVQLNINPVSAKVLTLFPAPNLVSASGNFLSSPDLQRDSDQFLIKIDHRMQNNDLVTARYSFNASNTFSPFSGSTNIPGFGSISNTHSQLLSFSHTHVLTPRLLNEFRFGFNRSANLAFSQPGASAVDYGFNNGYAPDAPLSLGNLPNISFAGGLVSGGGRISNLGGSGSPTRTNINTFQYIDNLSYTTEHHAWKVGGDIRRIQMNRLYDLDFSGQVTFNGSQNTFGISDPLADFELGLPASSLQFVGDSNRGLRTTSFNFFFQDNYRILSNFTLDYGLRYELNTVLHDVTHRLSTFRADRFQQYLSPTADQTSLDVLRKSGIVTQEEIGGIYDPDHNNWGPRVGLAYSVGGHNKIVIRSAYGVFYDVIIGNIPGNILLNPPYLPGNFNSAPGVAFPNSFGAAALPVLTVTEKNFKTPYAQHYNLNIQHELPGKILFEIGYVGSKGTRLPRFRQMNQAFITQQQIDSLTPSIDQRLALLGIPAATIAVLKTRINQMPPIARNQYFGFAQIFEADTSVNSNYNALQLKVDKQFSHGLSTLLSYTYSKSIDSGSVFFGSGATNGTNFPQDNFNPGAGERGLSDFDTRHRLIWNYTYQIPTPRGPAPAIKMLGGGWQVGGILTLQTGQPFSILTGSNNSSIGLGTDRPDLIGNPNTGPRTVQQFFNTSAFQLNRVLTVGNSGRNIVEGPGFHDFDLSLIKNTAVHENTNLQFRAEFFNFTNHPNFGLPSHVMGAANFGALFQTADVAQGNVGLGSGGPRLIQFGLKLIF